MKTIYILLTKKPNETFLKLVEQMQKEHEVNVYDVRKNKDYDLIVDDIFRHDKVMSW